MTDPDIDVWGRIKTAVCETDEPIRAIAGRYGVAAIVIENRRKREAWLRPAERAKIAAETAAAARATGDPAAPPPPEVAPPPRPETEPAVAAPAASPRARKPAAKRRKSPAKPKAKPKTKLTTKPAAEPVAKPKAKPAVEPAAKPAVKPAAKPVSEPATNPPAKKRRLNRQGFVGRIYSLIDRALRTLEMRTTADMQEVPRRGAFSEATFERDTRTIASIIKNLETLTEYERGLDSTGAGTPDGKRRRAAGQGLLSGEADLCRQQIAERLARLIEIHA